jgi:hypothetical protein
MITTRCSSLDRQRLCPASVSAEGVLVEHNDPTAPVGLAFHEGMPAAIVGVHIEAETLAKAWSVDADELGMLLRLGHLRWDQLREWFPEPQFEVELQYHDADLRLTGHADLHSVVRTEPDLMDFDEVRGLDWKTGFAAVKEHEWQCRGYGYLLLKEYPTCQRVRWCVVDVRAGAAEWYTWTRDELSRWWADLKVHLHKRSYAPSLDACRYCPRAIDCPARTRLLRQAVEALSLEWDAVQDGELLGRLLEDAKLVKALAEKAAEYVKTQVVLAGGTLGIGGGKELYIREQEKRTIDARLGLPVLANYITPEQMPDCLTIGKGKAEDLARSNAPPRRGKATVEAMLADLETAGALNTTTEERLEVRAAIQAITQVPQLENVQP